MAKADPIYKHDTVDWMISDQPVDYEPAVAVMERRVEAIHSGSAPELIWLLEHRPLYTAGTSARPQDLLTPNRFPVHQTGRGGQYTYHGPGQRVIYVMLDVKKRGRDVRAFVTQLESWLIDILASFHVIGFTRKDRVGVWVARTDKTQHGSVQQEDKIAAIGIRLRKWVSYHGMSLNIDPDLSHFDGIVPCGITQYGVTSFTDLGHRVSRNSIDRAIRQTFERRFGPTRLLKAHEQPIASPQS